MSATFHIPIGPDGIKLKYTDMAIYIDANISKVVKAGEHPDIEKNIYEYLYHIIYALALKAKLFRDFNDYDPFSLETAGDIYMLMIKRFNNIGKVIRGKEVVPIKSCLNFIKSILYPCKVNYQDKYFRLSVNQDLDPKGARAVDKTIRNSVFQIYKNDIEDSVDHVLQDFPRLINELFDKTPFKYDEYMRDKLYISVMLSLNSQLILPSNIIKNLRSKDDSEKKDKKLNQAYIRKNNNEIILWHLDNNWKNYVWLLTRKLKNKLSNYMEEDSTYMHLSENAISNIIASSFAEGYESFDSNEE